jgi:hypothetical protein
MSPMGNIALGSFDLLPVRQAAAREAVVRRIREKEAKS